jgi:WD40 repeat protein
MKQLLPFVALAFVGLALVACEEPEKKFPSPFPPSSAVSEAGQAGQAGQGGKSEPSKSWVWTDCGTFVPPDDLQRPPRDERQAFGVSISPDGGTMVVTDVYTAFAYRIAPNFQESTQLWQGDTGLELMSEFSPDGSMVAISGDGRRLLAADTGTSIFGPPPPPDVPTEGCNQAYFRFSHDGKLVAGGGYKFGVDVFDVSGQAPVATLPSQGCDSAAAFSPDDSLIATGKPELYRASDHTRVWPAVIGKDEPDHLAWATWVQFTSDGTELVVSTCRAAEIARIDRRFECNHAWYSAETGEVIGKSGSVTTSFAVLSPDGRFFVDSHSVHDRLTGGESVLRSEDDIQAAAFAPDRDIIAAVAGGTLHRFCAK